MLDRAHRRLKMYVLLLFRTEPTASGRKNLSVSRFVCAGSCCVKKSVLFDTYTSKNTGSAQRYSSQICFNNLNPCVPSVSSPLDQKFLLHGSFQKSKIGPLNS